MNFTDVDDRTIVEAQKAGLPLREYTDQWIAAFREDAARAGPRGRRGESARHRRARTSHAMCDLIQALEAQRAHLPQRRARSTSRSRRCPTTASWRAWITRASSPARASTRTSTRRRTPATSCCGRRRSPDEPTWDFGVGPGPAGLAHRVLGDGAAAARRHDRHPLRRRRPHLPAPRERDRAERRRHRQAVLAVLGPRRAPHPGRWREDVEVAGQRVHACATSWRTATARRRCATC